MLWNLCPPNTRALMSRALMTELLSNVTDITLLLHISRAAEEEGRLLTGISRQLYRTTYQTLSKAAKLRARLNLDPFLRGKILNAPQELSLADFEIVSSSVWDGKDIRLAVGRHPHRVHIVEFKKMHVAGTTSRKSSIWLHQLAEMLCAHDKPPEFQLLECRGYFVDRREGRWGFVFDLPPHCGEYFLPPVLSRRDLHYRKPTSLKELLRKQEGDAIDLATRFDLAKKLVAAVATIHASGFMHRNIRASSVLFFPDTSSDGDGPSKSRRKNLQQPFLQGWGYIDALDIVPSSYPQKPSNSTSLIIKTTATTLEEIDFYQHPYLTRYPNAPYCRAFDLYSLGLLLLEIGLWQPIATFTDGVDVVYQSREDAAERFKAHLERNYVADLKGQAGGRYEEVVRRLLGMWSYGEEKEREVEMRVVWEVVKRLEECVV